MTRIEETALPGVGVRHEFDTRDGDRIGVISHRTGRREFLLFSREDPDACRVVVRLQEDEGHVLAELLGGTTVTEHIGDATQQVEGMTIEWTRVKAGAVAADSALRDLDLSVDSGATIVAVVRDGHTTPAPRGDFVLEVGDTAVIIGTPDGIGEIEALLQGG